ncbi:MAG TPA: sigma-70 family RNA polymerase sigma factor [Planctomycetota bacterium]
MPEPRSDHAALLQEVSWIRRLARELVADRDLAEDLVQETCAVALERGPREAGKLRAWLAEVLRNLLRQHARSAGRRHRREGLAARPEELESTARLVERVSLQRELVNAVLALEEPYRTTVLLRFFEELPPREIARRTDTPLATVNSRLARALARLRERLDGENHAWAAILLPWVRGAEALGPATALPVLMNTKLILSGATLVLAAGALVLLRGGDDERSGGGAPAPAVLAGRDAPARPSASPSDGGGLREEAVPAPALPAAPAATGSPAPAPEATAWTVRLRVLDAEGQPMPGVEVCADGTTEVLGTSGRGGWCVFPTVAERLVLVASDPRWVTIHAGSPVRASSVDPVLVLAPALALAGVVLDELGRPLPGASVRFDLPEGFRTRFTEVLEATRSFGWRVAAGADGGFAFERVPAVAGASVSAVLDGYQRARLAAPLVPQRDLELVLARPNLPLAGTLRGRVLEPSGAPVPGARVGLGLASVLSDEHGAFELALARAVTTDVLTAVKAGHRPARLERPGEPSEVTTGWPDEVTLLLPGPALSIRGTVLDHEGAPVAGARLWVHDPTPGAPVGRLPTTLEAQMAGGPVPPAALESEASLPAADGDSFYDHYTTSESPTALWSWVESDAEGRFELPGLDERRYRLDVLRPEGLEIVTTRAFAAGETDARIRLDPPELFERVEGRVVAEDGTGLADVRVTLLRPLIDVEARVFGGRSQVVVLRNGGSALTDAAGRFHFERVPRSGARLDLRGDGIVPCAVDVGAPSLEIPVEQRCHLEVVLRESLGKYDAIEVADGEGRRLDILELTEGATNAWSGVELVDGRSGVVSVSIRARELRLMKSGVLVETRALDLVPGDVNRIEL